MTCPVTPQKSNTINPEHGVVAFDFLAWSKAYPALAKGATPEQVQGCFDLAGLYLNNSPASRVRDLNERRLLLWLLTAHIAQIQGITHSDAGGQGGQSGMVGRVSSATRGSVSVSTDAGGLPTNAGWFTQTQYGLTFWQATAKYRQMRVIPGRPHPARIWP